MYKTIPRHYPEAISITELETKIITRFVERKLGLKSTIWATSFCSDEVNNLFSPFYDLFAGPGPFILGGIAGLPFSGITGMSAFLSHAPNDGTALILYGPHIGVSKDGTLGQVNRQNQNAPSSCCGSLVTALNSLHDSDTMPESNPLDYQQARVIRHLYENKSEIMDSEDPLMKVTDYAYQAIHDKLYRIIDNLEDSFSDIHLYLIGGVVINTDWFIEDYFDVRNMDYISL